jgi:hypothetical protein
MHWPQTESGEHMPVATAQQRAVCMTGTTPIYCSMMRCNTRSCWKTAACRPCSSRQPARHHRLPSCALTVLDARPARGQATKQHHCTQRTCAQTGHASPELPQAVLHAEYIPPTDMHPNGPQQFSRPEYLPPELLCILNTRQPEDRPPSGNTRCIGHCILIHRARPKRHTHCVTIHRAGPQAATHTAEPSRGQGPSKRYTLQEHQQRRRPSPWPCTQPMQLARGQAPNHQLMASGQ